MHGFIPLLLEYVKPVKLIMLWSEFRVRPVHMVQVDKYRSCEKKYESKLWYNYKLIIYVTGLGCIK